MPRNSWRPWEEGVAVPGGVHFARAVIVTHATPRATPTMVATPTSNARRWPINAACDERRATVFVSDFV